MSFNSGKEKPPIAAKPEGKRRESVDEKRRESVGKSRRESNASADGSRRSSAGVTEINGVGRQDSTR